LLLANEQKRLAALEFLLPYPICSFRKPDGTPGGSPAQLGKKLCYYHQRDRQREQRIDTAIRRADVLGPRLPPMRSLDDVLAGLNEGVQALAEGRISDRRAGRVLFDLQQASAAIRRRHSGRK
jgi:hypothetical protein